jgi:hypothetical protein
MSEAYLGVVFIALMALLFGVVIFAGTTLIYFRDKHRKDPARTEVRELTRSREEEPVSVGAGSSERDQAA